MARTKPSGVSFEEVVRIATGYGKWRPQRQDYRDVLQYLTPLELHKHFRAKDPGERLKRAYGPRDYICQGRPPKSKAPSIVCGRVRGYGKGRKGIIYYTELFSTTTGKSLGFIGPDCTLVDSPAKAITFDARNKHKTVEGISQCKDKKGFLKTVRVKAKKGAAKLDREPPPSPFAYFYDIDLRKMV